jgi:hypothetical protein
MSVKAVNNFEGSNTLKCDLSDDGAGVYAAARKI